MAKSGMSYSEPGYERLGMHIAFHPKSFMANFVFNTNIWATKDKTLQAAGTHLFNDRELFPFYYPSNSRCANAAVCRTLGNQPQRSAGSHHCTVGIDSLSLTSLPTQLTSGLYRCSPRLLSSAMWQMQHS